MPYTDPGIYVEHNLSPQPLPPQEPDLPVAVLGPMFNIVEQEEAGNITEEMFEGTAPELTLAYPEREDENNPVDEDIRVDIVHRAGHREEIPSRLLTVTQVEITIDLDDDFYTKLNTAWVGQEDYDKLDGSTVEVSYRESREDLIGNKYLVQGTGHAEQTLGEASLDNPLGLAGGFAASVAPRTGAYYIPTADCLTDDGISSADSSSAVSAALAVIEPIRVHKVVLLSDMTDLHLQVLTHCNNMSEPEEGLYRQAWIHRTIPSVEEVVDYRDQGEAIDDITTIELKQGQADILESFGKSISDKRAIATFQPFTSRVDGEIQDIPAFYLNVVYAAFKASIAEQQGLTRYPVGGIVNELKYANDYFKPSQISQISNGGIFICKQNNSEEPIYAHGQWTTNMLNNRTKQLSLRDLVDSVSFAMTDTLDPLIGVNNVTPETIEVIKRSVGNLITTLKGQGKVIAAGIEEIFQDPDNEARVKLKVRFVFPTPLDQIVIVLEY